MRHGPIDEYRIYVHRIILGGGKRLFPPSEDRTPLRLTETQACVGGSLLLRDAVAAPAYN